MDQFDLGSYSRPISTTSLDAQRYFDLGLNWCYGFNYEEAAKCFHKAVAHDPHCVMAHWGVAHSSGPYINYVWRQMTKPEADRTIAAGSGAIAEARRWAHTASELENALVEATATRFQSGGWVEPELFDQIDDAYAAAMRSVFERFPNDHDVMALTSEALMMRTPWQLWDVRTGLPRAGADTLEALQIVERSMAFNDDARLPHHPGVLHFHIHLTEMSHEPERSLRAADLLSGMSPDNGHLNHMPSHTYVLCGDYEAAKAVSERAIAADDKYLAYAGALNAYTADRCHDLHLMMYTCMFLGQFEPALEAADRLRETLTDEVLRQSDKPQVAITMEGHYSMRMHVLVRFGRWQDIIDAAMPADPELYCVSTVMHHYAKAVAHATLGDAEAAQLERSSFFEALARVPEERRFLNNSALDILGIAEMMLEGEVAYHSGDYDQAFDCLREAVRRDDDLAYTEPWAWMHPPRHALGALLAEQGHHVEAEQVYRTDLGLNDDLQRCSQHPDNVWSLHGLVECMKQRSDTGQELAPLEAKLAVAVAKADVPVTSSCMCRRAGDSPA